MAAKKLSNTMVWILMALLIFALGGFGVTNLSGSVQSIGQVGDTEISVNDYFRDLQQELNARRAQTGEPLSLAQAQAAGIDRAVLSRLVAQAALKNETARLGLSIGDRNLGRQIQQIPQFQGVDGKFDRQSYSFALSQSGMSEAEFEEGIRSDAATGILQSAVLGGITPPAAYTDNMVQFIGQQRDATWAVLGRSDLKTGVPVPEEADLKAYYDAHPDVFTTPEIKRISYARMTPDMLIDTVKIDDAALREAYEARHDEFNQPERRLIERLVFSDEEKAEAAMARIAAGDSFETLVSERGLELADIDMGDVAKSELGAAGDPVFAAETGEITGPHPSDLGPAIYRINAILDAHTVSFEEAEEDLRDDLAADRARRVIETKSEEINDLLAGGATIEDLARETEMENGQIAWHQGAKEDIAAYEAFREAAAALQEDDYPEVLHLGDGGIFAMRLDEIVPPALEPIGDVQVELRDLWTQEAIVKELKAQIEPDLAKLREGADFADLNLKANSLKDMTRQSRQTNTPRNFITAMFEMEDGDVRVLDGNGQIFVLRLDEISPPDMQDPEMEQIRSSLEAQAAGGLSQDIYRILTEDIQERAGLSLDQAAINAVHSNF